MNHTLTIQIPDNIYQTIITEAKTQAKSPEEIVVEKISPYSFQDKRSLDPLFADDEIYEGDAPIDGALNHDKYIYNEHPFELAGFTRWEW